MTDLIYVKCKIDGCLRNAHKSKQGRRGWCSPHYNRWWRNGDPISGRNPPETAKEWINSVALKHTSDECLYWPFSVAGKGYGIFGQNKKKKYAHRVVCAAINGPPPSPKHQASHSCGMGHKGCVSPKHLRWATCAENHLDKKQHGTHVCGDKSPNSKLTYYDVVEIRKLRASGAKLNELAKLFGVSFQTISSVANRKTWRHVNDR